MSKIFTLLLVLLSVVTFGQKESPYVPGELLVQVTSNDDVDKIVQDLLVIEGVYTGVEVKTVLSKHSRIWQFTFDEELVEARDMRSAFWMHPSVEIVQFNHYVTLRETPNDPDYGSQWHHNDFTDNDIDTEEAWDITTGGTTAFGDEIVVCVIEGGNLNHVDLEGNKWFNEGEIPDDGIDNDGNGYIDDYDGWNVGSNDDSGVFNGGHGTQVMGMIGAKGNNDMGVVGANWDVKIMSVAGENIGNESSVIAAYDYAMNMRMIYNETGGASGAFVVATNASWGIDNGDPATIPLWCEFYNTLGENGILNCGATANNNVNIDVVGDIPTACASDYMISVTATNSADVRTFSGYGATTIDLGAPGEAVWTTQGTNGYGATSGTSFASPLTAGAIALIYSTPCPSFMALVQGDPQAGADYVREVLFEGTDAVSNLSDECVTGGRLNVNNSINLILESCSDSDCLTPFSVAATPAGDGNYDVTWGNLNSMIGFNVRYREVGAPEWINVDGLTDPNYTIEGSVWCTEYEVQVMALCEDGESEWSNSVIWLTEGCCENPDFETIVLDAISNNSATISWEDVLAAESYNIEFTSTGGMSETITGITDNTYTFSELTECTIYSVMIQVVCADETLGFTDEFTFNTVGCGACADLEFCASLSENATEEWIERVQVQDIDNTSGMNDGYADYTGSPDIGTTLDPGGSYTVTFTPGFDGFEYEEHWVIWIDFNQNGTFDDNEVVFDSEGGSTEPATGLLEIPTNAPEGSARMRVSMKYVGGFGGGEAPEPCEEFAFGEVEDYCVEITDNVIDNVLENGAVQWNVYPNPATDVVNISLAQGNYNIEMTDLTGRTVLQQVSNGSTQLSLNGLANGVYMIRLFDGASLVGVQKIVVD